MRRTDISPLTRLMQRIDAVADGAPSVDTAGTGFPSVDRLLGGGVRSSDLIVLGGDVASGKSSLVLGMALRMALDGASVAYFSGEMTVERLLERALAIEGRVRVDAVREGGLEEHERASVGAAAIRLRDSHPRFATIPSGGVEGLRAELTRSEPRPRVAFVDSVAALAGGTAALADELAEAVRQLKALAVSLEVALVVTSPLFAFDGGRRDRRPILDDFGILGSVKQHADVVLALYREDMYDPGTGVEGATELLVRKNRNGPTGYADLYFFRKWMRFEDMLDPDR